MSTTILAPDGSPARGHTRPSRSRASSWYQVYEAANRADFRGYFYLPTLDPAEQLDGLTRSALAERIDFLYKNVGAVTMLIDTLALQEVGAGIWPKWTTGNEDFDKAATDGYHFTNHDPRVFSADGQNDAYSVQYAIRRCIGLYGDCFGQLLRPAPGALMPQMHLIPGWQCDNPANARSGDGWSDGIRTNALGRPIEYCFTSAGLDGKRSETIVPADDVLHFHDPFLPRQRRGAPALASVAKKLFRREDIGKALANGTLARERLGYALEVGGDDGGPKMDIGGEGSGESEEVENADGSKYTLRRIFGPGADEEIEIPQLPAGTKLATVESNRPGTAVMEFQDSILREAAWARRYPAEYVFFSAGIGQGTVARGVMLQAGAVIVSTREFQLRPQFCIRHPVYWIWQMIKGGYFAARKIAVPENWWMHKLIMPALPTMDVGREGGLHDNRVATLRESIEAYHGMQGDDAADVEDENLSAIKRRVKKLAKLNQEISAELAALGMPAFTYDQTWARSINTPVQMVSAAPAEGNG